MDNPFLYYLVLVLSTLLLASPIFLWGRYLLRKDKKAAASKSSLRKPEILKPPQVLYTAVPEKETDQVESKITTKQKEDPQIYKEQISDKKKSTSVEKKTAQSTNRESKIFLSYRRADSADITGRIYDRLIAHFGQDKIFKDVDSIPLGADFKEYIDDVVSECRVFLVVIGREWTGLEGVNRRIDNPGDFVRIEVEAALKRQIPIIPTFVRGAEMPSGEELPSSIKLLAFRNGIPIRSDPDFHRDMDRLIAGLEKVLSDK